MLAATKSFLSGLQAWALALENEDFDEAKFQAKNCLLHGGLLVIHPDFIRCFREHTKGGDPKEALNRMCELLNCTTHAREQHAKPTA